MKINNRKHSFVLLISLFITASSVAIFTHYDAGIVMASSLSKQPRNEAEAIKRINDLCNKVKINTALGPRDAPAGHAAWVTNVKFDEDTGEVTYKLNTIWRSCHSAPDTRSYAITGYPASGFSGGLTICPNVGTYGFGSQPWDRPVNPTAPQTHDCTKYIGTVPYSAASYLGCDAGRKNGPACISPAWVNDHGLFRREDKPSYSINKKVIELTGKVPGWATVRNTKSQHRFGAANALCSFFKLNINGSWDIAGKTYFSAQMCQDVFIDVTWKNYNLLPSINIPNTSIPVGAKLFGDVTGAISNNGLTSTDSNIVYGVVRFAVRGGYPGRDISGSDIGVLFDPHHPGNLAPTWACDVATRAGLVHGFNVDRDSCLGKELAMQPTGATIDRGDHSINFPQKDTIEDIGLKVGDSLCYATVVNRYTHNVAANVFRYAMQCVRVAKQPKVQVWGGDVRTANQVITSHTNIIDGGTSVAYGSWAEYGIIANKDVRSASGAGLSSGDAGRTNADVTRLTFANAGVSMPGNFTNEAFNGAVRVPPVSSVNSGVLSGVKSVASLQGNYTATNLRLDGGEVAAGRRILIQASGTITITGDIRYTAAQLSDTKNIPQLVIVAKNIIIEPQVERVDAWLMSPAGGSISTCGAGVSQQPAKDIDVAACSKQLRINGPVHADKLYLRRTYGGEGKAPIHFGTPAEVLNLRPDAYLWGHGSSFTTGAIRTMHVRELPPRL